FDAVVGNPPFIGGKKLTGALGTDYREYLVNRLAGGTRGHADLCAYFLLRNLSLAPGRRAGIIATNTIAQGDTREVGLDQATDAGWTVYRAIKSQPWPGTAALEVSLIWLGCPGEGEPRTLDEHRVRGITPSLDSESRVSGRALRLAANSNKSFQGTLLRGMGFVLEPSEAQALIAENRRNADVLFPYLSGEDLNSQPDCSASRWAIDFRDWSEERARTYPEVWNIIESQVKPVREAVAPGSAIKFWHHWRRRPELHEAIAGFSHVIAIARVSSTAAATFVPTGQVLHEKLIVFPSDSPALLTLLNSNVHIGWAWKYSATLKADLQYTPSDCYETFPHPTDSPTMTKAGSGLHSARQAAMASRSIGLTKLYKLVHAETEQATEIEAIRKAHVAVDNAVVQAYGWTDLDPKHGFYETRQGPRFTIDPIVQTEILDRLLELNHARYKEEEAAGLHAPGAKKKAAPKRNPKPKTEPKPEDGVQDGIF
ncbi:type IIL restriction-modification enzyme MmeI, partial [Streptomyces parvus]|uniref:type IIL restriction-modification enzyme MmeI n=1 Tax=Streptomyces parvus TaxID=66428 RepID=UPI00292A3C40